MLYLGLYSLIRLPLVGVHGFVLIAAPYAYKINIEIFISTGRTNGTKVPGLVYGILGLIGSTN